MKRGVNEIWADHPGQGIREKIQGLEFMARPFLYNIHMKTLFSNPRKKAVKKIRKYARKWNYKFIFYKHCDVISRSRFSNSLFKQCNLTAILYSELLKSSEVLED